MRHRKNSQSVPTVRSLTDNWLLQHVAEVMTGSEDPRQGASLMDVDPERGLVTRPVLLGALQLASLGSFIEQLVLSETLFVMAGWLSSWRGRVRSLDSLIGTDVIKGIDEEHEVVKEAQERYNKEFCDDPAVFAEHAIAMASFAQGSPMFSGQLINGTSGYLALAELTNLAYWPHPARAHFLQRTIYNRQPRHDVYNLLEERVSSLRLRYSRSVTARSASQSLSMVIPALAYLCIMESTPQLTPVDVAVQLRNDKSAASLREALAEVAAASSVSSEALERAARGLDEALEEIARKLPLGVRSQSAVAFEFTAFAAGPSASVPLSVPEFLQRRFPQPRHMSILTRLVRAGRLPVDQVVRRALGTADRQLIEGVLQFNAILDAASAT